MQPSLKPAAPPPSYGQANSLLASQQGLETDGFPPIDRTFLEATAAFAISSSVTELSMVQSPDAIPLPCVLPQTSKSFRGYEYSPFVRAYAPEFGAHGIDQDTFLAFIDGLNEAYIAHPAFEVMNIVGSVMSSIPGIHPVQWAGYGLTAGAIIGSKATSYGRARAYLKAINTKLFHPLGLNAKLMSTKEMMTKVGCSEEKLNLPPFETFADINETAPPEPVQEDSLVIQANSDDARMRRIKALKGYVVPLNFDVPAAISPANLYKRLGDAHAQRLSRRQQEKFAKKREKGIEKYHERHDEARVKQLEGEQAIASLERKLQAEQSRFESKISAVRANSKEWDKLIRDHEKESAKIKKDIEKETEEVEKAVAKNLGDAEKHIRKADVKEEKIAQKIKWAVISRWEPTEEDDFEDDDKDEEIQSQ